MADNIVEFKENGTENRYDDDSLKFIELNGEMKFFRIYQNKEEGTTTIVLENNFEDADDVIARRVGSYKYEGLTGFLPDEIKGTTHLHPQDKFDEKIGFTKAMRKALRTRKRLINAQIKELVRRLVKDAVQLNRDEAYKVMDDIRKNDKRTAKDGV